MRRERSLWAVLRVCCALWLSYAFMIGPLVAAISLLIWGSYLAETRHLERHLRPGGYDLSDLVPGDIIAVSGILQGRPVELAAGYPQFPDALMVVEVRQRTHNGKAKGKWLPLDQTTWVSAQADLDGWALDRRLISRAGLPSYHASLCGAYRPPPGWRPDCVPDRPTGYAYRIDAEGERLAYFVTPIPGQLVTVLAAVSEVPGTLTAIQHGLDGEPRQVAFTIAGRWSAEELLAQRKHRQLMWMALCGGISLSITALCMFGMLRRDRQAPVPAALWGGLWRAAVVMSPYAVALWPFDAGGYWVVAIIAVIFSGLIALTMRFYYSMDPA